MALKMGHFHLFMFIFLKHFAVACSDNLSSILGVETETTKEHKQLDPEMI